MSKLCQPCQDILIEGQCKTTNPPWIEKHLLECRTCRDMATWHQHAEEAGRQVRETRASLPTPPMPDLLRTQAKLGSRKSVQGASPTLTGHRQALPLAVTRQTPRWRFVLGWSMVAAVALLIAVGPMIWRDLSVSFPKRGSGLEHLSPQVSAIPNQDPGNKLSSGSNEFAVSVAQEAELSFLLLANEWAAEFAPISIASVESVSVEFSTMLEDELSQNIARLASLAVDEFSHADDPAPISQQLPTTFALLENLAQELEPISPGEEKTWFWL